MNIKMVDIIENTFLAQNVVLIYQIHAKNIIGVERQLAQADRLVQFAAEHLTHSDMLGAQTGFRMKTIIGISAMSATKKKMFPSTLGIAVRSPFLQPVQHQGKKHTPVLYAATE